MLKAWDGTGIASGEGGNFYPLLAKGGKEVIEGKDKGALLLHRW
jgi:hypothetical protein